MGIRDALAHSKQKQLKVLSGGREMLNNGLLTIADGVFEVSLYHLGLDFENWRYEPLNERDFILDYLSKKHD